MAVIAIIDMHDAYELTVKIFAICLIFLCHLITDSYIPLYFACILQVLQYYLLLPDPIQFEKL